MADADERIASLEAEVQRLQGALSFWLPGVPVDLPDVLADRVAFDAVLLTGYEGEIESSAEDLGWLALQPPGHWVTP